MKIVKCALKVIGRGILIVIGAGFIVFLAIGVINESDKIKNRHIYYEPFAFPLEVRPGDLLIFEGGETYEIKFSATINDVSPAE